MLMASPQAVSRYAKISKVSSIDSKGGLLLASSPASDAQRDSKEGALGGIDFRSLPAVTQPTLYRDSPLGAVPLNTLAGTVPVPQLDNEWSQIEKMIRSGITPSSQRLKEYLQASCLSQDSSQRIDVVLSCIADIFRLEEERASSTESALREIVALLESDRPVDELQLALAKITITSKDSKAIKAP